MRLELTRIGNSRGIRIPKPLIAQCGLGDEVEVRVTPEGLLIAPRYKPRSGWKQALRESLAAKSAPEKPMLDGVTPNAFDDEDWQW